MKKHQWDEPRRFLPLVPPGTNPITRGIRKKQDAKPAPLDGTTKVHKPQQLGESSVFSRMETGGFETRDLFCSDAHIALGYVSGIAPLFIFWVTEGAD